MKRNGGNMDILASLRHWARGNEGMREYIFTARVYRMVDENDGPKMRVCRMDIYSIPA